MVVLNETLITSKARVQSLEEVRREQYMPELYITSKCLPTCPADLNACGQGIDDVSLLQQLPNAEVLSLSVNKISSLRPFAFCGKLQQLYLRANVVTDLAEIRYLMPLQHLRVLWLADNPCTRLPQYRACVVANLPHLEDLDSVAVTDADRQAAKAIHPFKPATAADALAEEQALIQQQAAASAGEQSPWREEHCGMHSPVPPTVAVCVSAMNQVCDLNEGASPEAGLPKAEQQQWHGRHITPTKAASSTTNVDAVIHSTQTAAGMEPIQHLSPACAVQQPMVPSITDELQGNYAMHVSNSNPDTSLQQRCANETQHACGVPASNGTGAVHHVEAQRRQQVVQCTQYHLCVDHGKHCCHCQPVQSYKPQLTPLQWQTPEPQVSRLVAGMAASGQSTSRTNVLYAVMALLGELDAAALSIVHREVQLRLTAFSG